MPRNYQPPEDYKLSRAALRNRYGTRSIDASAPQSSRDFTPSGRTAYLQQQGATPAGAIQQQQQEFKANFPFQLAPQVSPRMAQIPPNPPLLSTPPKPMGLLPTTIPPEEMVAFLPPTTTPLNGFSLPQNGILNPRNKWRTFG
jgi:hypothetical protein